MKAFIPLFIFLISYLGSSIYFSFVGINSPLNQVSPVVYLLPALLFAVLLQGKDRVQHNIDTIIKGMGDRNTITMCLIFLFSGAFSSVTQSINSTSIFTDLIFSLLPAKLLLPGIFLTSAFISTAIGTSVGVVTVMVPIAVNMAQGGAFGLEIGTATVVGGAVFGDNLSMISDTTIASVSSQGAKVKDKLKANFKVALISSIITLVLLLAIGNNIDNIEEVTYKSNLDYISMINIIPYISLIIMGFLEISTLITLTINTFISGILGMIFFDYTLTRFLHEIYHGFERVNEIVIFTLFISGLSFTMYKQGQKALHRLIDKSKITRTRTEFLISGIASMFTALVANNTIAILLSGNIAKKLAKKHNIAPYRSAYLLDVFACATKGMLPYGSQLLIASNIASVSSISLLEQMYYCFVLVVVSILEIIFNSNRHSKMQNQNLS